ncbi:restriction endonuclease subunit S [Nocardioides sp. YIM 152315]|uniref:restriction endonuclease subunit S n=1 Tax=Nocardioides sp. YIM 152315 TaxID=3031760 RepID=UPI0023DA222A|nr:restriction endonuclease subunit S [Nocardioides sp. YIM 152315]MDF1603521.1 restriction endonuclease subunit S [Nocardioides sp. YIM 152315]
MTWQRVPLKDVGTWYGGATPSKSNATFWTGGTIPWLSPKDMGPEVLTETLDHITPAAVGGSSVKLVPGGSVAVVVRSGIIERTIPVSLVPFDTTLNQDMKAVEPRPDIDPRWIAWSLRAFERELLRETRKTGTTVASIEWPRFQAFEIPVPPIDEQRRIVDLLEDHLSRLDAASRAIAESLVRLKALRDSALLSVVADAQRHGQSETHSLGELARVSSGMTPLRGNKAFYDGGTIPWITSGDLHQGLITKPTQFVTQRALDETSLKIVPAGSLLVAMYGEGKTRGTAAELGLDATTNQACAAITFHEPDLRAWVRLILDANYTGLRRLAAGGVQPNLNLSLIKAIEVPVPPAETRRMLISRITRIDEGRERMKEELLSAHRRGTSLRRSLLKAAFSGPLTGAESDLSAAEEMIGA